MPKTIPPKEFELIETAIKRFSEGAKLDELLKIAEINLSRRTLQRRLNSLIRQGRITVIGKGISSKYLPSSPTMFTYDGFQIPISNEGKSIQNYLNQQLINRKTTSYNRTFLDNYHPNETHYLSISERRYLKEMGSHHMATKIAGTHAANILHHFLLDLSWNSSRLEGNTYSLLETEKLLELGEQSKNKDTSETQMLLNHKAAIEFLVNSADSIAYNRSTILNLHALLSDNLLSNTASCGRLRNKSVGITKTTYSPTDIPALIDEYFQKILDTANKILDPFEQSFFVMVHLSYLQPFEDVNKRVSRLAANISLIQHNLSPLSFVNVPEEAYIDGLLGVYELNQIELLKDVFMWAYKQSADRYKTNQTLGEPDPFKLKYRQQLIEIIGNIVRQHLNIDVSTSYIRKWSENNIPDDDQARFIEITETELLNLHSGNFARFKLKKSEFESWSKIDDWDHIRAARRDSEIKREWRKTATSPKENEEWTTILEKGKRSENNVVYWSYPYIMNFFDLDQNDFDNIINMSMMSLLNERGLQDNNHFDPINSRLTRHACFSIAKVLEKNEPFKTNQSLKKKAELSQYYFGGYPCNIDTFDNRIIEGRVPGNGEIRLEHGEDDIGFNNIFGVRHE